MIFKFLLVLTNITGIRGKPTVLEGRNLQSTCEALGRPEPTTLGPKRNSEPRKYCCGAKGKVLTITNINRTDEVEFTCTAYNSFGKLEKPTVHVNFTCEYTLIGKNFDQC